MPGKLTFNGVNGGTGRPLLPELAPEELVGLIDGSNSPARAAERDALQTAWEKRHQPSGGVLGLDDEYDEEDLAEARWGAIYHPDTPAEVRAALQELVDARGGIWLEYQPPESARDFRTRHGQGAGVVNPEKLPYYLLIVGPPEQISFRFQYNLDNEHAVGRIAFDTAEEYHRYARAVLDYENGRAPTRERRAAFFSPTHPYDDFTAMSAGELAGPLAQLLDGKQLTFLQGGKLSYATEHITGQGATRAALLDLLTRPTRQPALIFTASHGVGFDKGHPLQRRCQGALVTSEWPGPKSDPLNGLPETMYLAGQHLPAAARFDGLIAFAFACYSAGTPQLDDFAHLSQQAPIEIAAAPFVGQLPQRLLAQGALAFIGHVDRAWSFSFLEEQFGRDITTFKSTLTGILRGKRIGHAFEDFNDRCGDLARELTDTDEESMLRRYRRGEPVLNKLIDYWVAHNDARAYVVFGDPAVRLRPGAIPTAP